MSLSDALRAAALERARRSGHTIDGVVIEPTGVIDLREMARNAGRESDRSVKLPVISGHRPRPDRDPEPALTETSLWRRLRPAPDGPATDADDPAALEFTRDEPGIDLDDLDALFGDADGFEPIVIDITEIEEPPSVHERNGLAPIDATLADEAGRPVAVCGHCGSFGQRDLLDRFSGTEYYSCDDCGHMWQQLAED
ncbi:MAG: hypothetical protein AAGA90_04135 [Actinomycetota bacterium]